MAKWLPIDTAPKDGAPVIIMTADKYAIEGYWDADQVDFYKSQEGWASYDPANAQGTWVSYLLSGKDKRMFCGSTPKMWMPIPKLPANFDQLP